MTDAEINNAVAEVAGMRTKSTGPDKNCRVCNGRGYVTHYDREIHTDQDCECYTPAMRIPDYANSLDAIVPVVREWCEKHGDDCDWAFGYTPSYGLYAYIDDPIMRESHRNPARALCLALIQAVEASK